MLNTTETEILLLMKPEATGGEISDVLNAISRMGLRAEPLVTLTRTFISIVGRPGAVDPLSIENLPGVADVIRVSSPYKLVSREAKAEGTTVRIGEAAIGGEELAIIAGPCAVESHKQAFAVAESVHRSGARFFRGGAFKPRTSPYTFQGLGEEGLQILAQIRQAFGLKIITEAMDAWGMDLVERYGDVVQIGARNMQNFPLLRRAGRSHLPVLLKRGMGATVDEWLLAAEYVMSEGNQNIVLCERGVRSFVQHTKNLLDLAAVAYVKLLSHLPVVVDPSHGTGKNYLVGPMARAGVAVGADGVMVELHDEPGRAVSDGAQALTVDEYERLVAELRAIHEAVSPAKVC